MVDRVLLVRQEWADAYRSVKGDGAIAPQVLGQMEAVTEALRRRIGHSFTVNELVDAYDRSDAWALDAIAERATESGWIRTASPATDAAFHLYARGARDYTP